MADERVERIYTIPLGEAYDYTRKRRAPRAVKLLRQFVSRHMKSDAGSVLLSTALNGALWRRSIQKPPRRVKVRVIKQAGIVHVYLPDEKTEEEQKAKKEAEEKAKKEAEEKARKEKEKKEAAEKKEPAPKKEEAKPAAPAKPAAEEKTPQPKAEEKKPTHMPAEKSGHGSPLPELSGNREAKK